MPDWFCSEELHHVSENLQIICSIVQGSKFLIQAFWGATPFGMLEGKLNKL